MLYLVVGIHYCQLLRMQSKRTQLTPTIAAPRRAVHCMPWRQLLLFAKILELCQDIIHLKVKMSLINAYDVVISLNKNQYRHIFFIELGFDRDVDEVWDCAISVIF